MLTGDYRPLYVTGRIAMAGGDTEWMGEPSGTNGKATDSLWRVYPEGFLQVMIPGIIGVEINISTGETSVSDEQFPTPVPPAESSRTLRAG